MLIRQVISQVKAISISSIVMMGLLACGGDENQDLGTADSYRYQQPEPGADWRTEGASNLGVDVATLESMMNRRDLAQQNIHSILVVKDNYLIFEEYFSGQDSQGNTIDFDKDTRHEVWSVTKSVASLLVGRAMDEGYISSLDDPISSSLPEYQHLFVDTEKESLNLYQCLTMQSGILWGAGSSVGLRSFVEASDPIDYLLSLRSTTAPGTEFSYNTGVSSLIAEIIEYHTGQSIRDYAASGVFSQLNLTDLTWAEHPSGHIYSGFGISMLPRDMAKLGQLVLDDGQWNGEQVISQDWIQLSTMPHVIFEGGEEAHAYGYYWWIRDFAMPDSTTTTAIYAAGYGGQYIFVLPDYALVVVFTSGNFGGNTSLPHTIVEEDILPSIFIGQP